MLIDMSMGRKRRTVAGECLMALTSKITIKVRRNAHQVKRTQRSFCQNRDDFVLHLQEGLDTFARALSQIALSKTVCDCSTGVGGPNPQTRSGGKIVLHTYINQTIRLSGQDTANDYPILLISSINRYRYSTTRKNTQTVSTITPYTKRRRKTYTSPLQSLVFRNRPINTKRHALEPPKREKQQESKHAKKDVFDFCSEELG